MRPADEQTISTDEAYPICADEQMPFAKLNTLQSDFEEKNRLEIDSVVKSDVGSGMSALAYIAVQRFFSEGKRIVFTGPTKALVESFRAEAALSNRTNTKRRR